MKKRIIAVTAIFMIGLILTGCGGTGITKDSKSADILNYLNEVENKDGSWIEKTRGTYVFVPTGEFGEACDFIDYFAWTYSDISKCEDAAELATYTDAVELVSDRVIPRYADLSKKISEDWEDDVNLQLYTSNSEKGPIYWEQNGEMKYSQLW